MLMMFQVEWGCWSGGQVGAEVDGVEHAIDVGVGMMQGVELVLLLE
jgi:hypothetical protein